MKCRECFMEIEVGEFHDYNCCLEFQRKTKLIGFSEINKQQNKIANRFAELISNGD